MSLCYVRLHLGFLYPSAYRVMRNGIWIGDVVRIVWPRRWQAASPGALRAFLLDEDGCPRWFWTREDATLALAMRSEGIAL